jgi:hypothetical protein
MQGIVNKRQYPLGKPGAPLQRPPHLRTGSARLRRAPTGPRQRETSATAASRPQRGRGRVGACLHALQAHSSSAPITSALGARASGAPNRPTTAGAIRHRRFPPSGGGVGWGRVCMPCKHTPPAPPSPSHRERTPPAHPSPAHWEHTPPARPNQSTTAGAIPHRRFPPLAGAE